jgi:hypothetical protein
MKNANGTNGSNGTLFPVTPHSRAETSCNPEISFHSFRPSVHRATDIARLRQTVPGVKLGTEISPPAERKGVHDA